MKLDELLRYYANERCLTIEVVDRRHLLRQCYFEKSKRAFVQYSSIYRKIAHLPVLNIGSDEAGTIVIELKGTIRE